jgi:hypothetical protein
MKSFLFLAALLLNSSLSIMAISPFAGTWELSEMLDADSNILLLPEGKTFDVMIEEVEEGQLKIIVKIGNNMRSKITLMGGDSPQSQEVSFGGVMSTMMMPAPELYVVEKFLSNTLPTITKMDITTEDKLVLEGDGTIIFIK